MKLLYKKIASFLLLPLVLLVLLGVVVSVTEHTTDYQLDASITDVYSGDSHMQCSVNDSLLPGAKNMANSGESFYFSYFKLLKVFEHNPQVKRLFLGVSYHSLSNYYDEYITGQYASAIAPNYFTFLPIKDQLKTFYYSRRNLPKLYKNVLSVNSDYLFHHTGFDEVGYFNEYNHTAAIHSLMDKRLAQQFYDGDTVRGFSSLNLQYLAKIVDLCQLKGVELIFVNAPLHSYYQTHIPPVFIEKYQLLVHQYRVKLIDVGNMGLGDSGFIPDGDHLSPEGAAEFTKLLKVYGQ